MEDELPTIKEQKELVKEVKLQYTGRQYLLQLPRGFVEALDLEKGDVFIIKVPLNNVKNYSIKLKEK